MKPTLDQGGKVLQLISQSGRTEEWVQEHLIGSGAFSDLLGVDNLRDTNRDERRRFLGLDPLQPQLLKQLGTVNTPATTDPLIVRDEFVVGKNGISYVGENIKQWFYPKVEAPTPAATLRYSKLTRGALDDEIRKEIGAEREETAMGQVLYLIRRQKNGKPGKLLTNGCANIFHVKDASGTLQVVRVYWYGDGWGANAGSVTYPSRWFDGLSVFSRDS